MTAQEHIKAAKNLLASDAAKTSTVATMLLTESIAHSLIAIAEALQPVVEYKEVEK